MCGNLNWKNIRVKICFRVRLVNHLILIKRASSGPPFLMDRGPGCIQRGLGVGWRWMWCMTWEHLLLHLGSLSRSEENLFAPENPPWWFLGFIWFHLEMVSIFPWLIGAILNSLLAWSISGLETQRVKWSSSRQPQQSHESWGKRLQFYALLKFFGLINGISKYFNLSLDQEKMSDLFNLWLWMGWTTVCAVFSKPVPEVPKFHQHPWLETAGPTWWHLQHFWGNLRHFNLRNPCVFGVGFPWFSVPFNHMSPDSSILNHVESY